uniref:Uncharacterized protein n=1 Tax=Anser cygnoides TaxID=8845 RepID=A0A8B9DV93_ANSCY
FLLQTRWLQRLLAGRDLSGGLGWREYSLTPKTGTGEGPFFPHHYYCSSDGVRTLLPPSILPWHCPSLSPVLPSCLLLQFLLSQHQQATRAPARREELALQWCLPRAFQG